MTDKKLARIERQLVELKQELMGIGEMRPGSLKWTPLSRQN